MAIAACLSPSLAMTASAQTSTSCSPDVVRTGQANPPSANHSLHFVNNDHWMTDTAGGNDNGDSLRPNHPFTFENGKLVVEADVAAGITDYGNGMVLSKNRGHNGFTSTTDIVDSLYAYGAFGGFPTVGCRAHPAANLICAEEGGSHSITTTDENRSNCFASAPSLVLEVSTFELCGTTSFGALAAATTPSSGDSASTTRWTCSAAIASASRSRRPAPPCT
jgi:hypothetical protein